MMEEETRKEQNPYEKLREAVMNAGLFKKRPLFYAVYGGILILGSVFSIYALTLSTNLLVQTLNALFLAVVSMQIGYLGHDIAHHQVFSSLTKDRWIGSTVYALGIGVSLEHWYGGHNEHHKYTNQVGKDPDIDLPLVFSEEQLKDRGPFYRKFILPHQHWYFFLFMPLAYLNYIIASIPWRLKKIVQPIRQYEFLLTIIHFTVLLWAVFGTQGLWAGVYFLALYAVATGTYAGYTFAPNHKGEKILPSDARITYESQITSTRNIFGSPVTDLVMGGLNYQVEHHLFPNLPRPNLRKVQQYVKAFCREHNIRYHEIHFMESAKEMYRTLRHFSLKKGSEA